MSTVNNEILKFKLLLANKNAQLAKDKAFEEIDKLEQELVSNY